MYHPRLRGTHYEIGYHYAALLYKNGFRSEQLPAHGLAGQALRESLKAVQAAYPEILDEIRGFADGCHGSYEQLASFLLSVGAVEDIADCSCFAVYTGTTTIFARNHDGFTKYKRFAESSLIVPQGYHAFVGNAEVFIGREDGVNEKGLAVGMTFVSGKVKKPGINFPLVIRCLLEKCDAVSAAIELLRKMQLSTSQNFVLADRSGVVAVVEACPSRMEIRYPEKGGAYIIATNNFRHSQMIPFEQEGDRNWYHSLTRYETLQNQLQSIQSELTVRNCQAMLADKRVCQYEKKLKFDTLWSLVADLRRLKLFCAEGNPGKTKYKEDARLTWQLAQRASR